MLKAEIKNILSAAGVPDTINFEVLGKVGKTTVENT